MENIMVGTDLSRPKRNSLREMFTDNVLIYSRDKSRIGRDKSVPTNA